MLSSFIFLFFLNFSVAQEIQELEPCGETWPEITSASASGPRLASTDLPFDYNIRLSCLPNESFLVHSIQGVFKNDEIVVNPLYNYTFAYPSGEKLYRLLFVPPTATPRGIYLFSGCLEVEKIASEELHCIELPEINVEIIPQHIPAANGIDVIDI